MNTYSKSIHPSHPGENYYREGVRGERERREDKNRPKIK